jgi:RNA polymerase sigma factor (sigma-70 family)
MSADAAAQDRELLEAWRSGDRARGNELFRRHVAAISRFFRTKVPDHAEDLTQSTFLALLKSEAGFRGDASFRAFLFGIARLQLLQHFRSKGRGKEQFDPLTCSVIDGGASPARLVCRHEQQALVARAMQRLPVDTQLALELHYFEGLSIEEIAAATGDAVGTIKSRLSRGRDQLSAKLAELTTAQELLSSTVNDLDRWVRSVPEGRLSPRRRRRARTRAMRVIRRATTRRPPRRDLRSAPPSANKPPSRASSRACSASPRQPRRASTATRSSS